MHVYCSFTVVKYLIHKQKWLTFHFVVVNGVCIGQEEEEEEDEGNACKVDEGGATVCGMLWWFNSIAAEFIFT